MQREVFNIDNFEKYSGYTPADDEEKRVIKTVYNNFNRWNNSEVYGCFFFNHGGMKAINTLYSVLKSSELIMERIKEDKKRLEHMEVLYGLKCNEF